MRIERPYYLKQLIDAEGNNAIKIITGLRRSGKSYLLKTLFKDYLLAKGVESSHIIVIDLEDKRHEAYLDPHYLLKKVDERISRGGGLFYLIIDEVQKIKDFVDVLGSLNVTNDVDVYVTGSNSKFLSSDIATEFRGRGDEIRMHPLSFAEYMSAYDGSIEDGWNEYMLYGGLPHVLNLKGEAKKISYLKNLYETVYLKDIYERHEIEFKDEFEELVRILASCIGSSTNPANIANTFKSIKKLQAITDKTISTYISYILDTFMISRADKYDIKGKQYIGTSPKYYFEDAGLRNAILDFRQNEWNHVMENIIYNELVVRGFNVDVGNVTLRERDKEGASRRVTLEVDFIANLGNRRYYVQSAWRMPDQEKILQESKSLVNIKDSFKKMIVVGESLPTTRDEQGIATISYKHFLMNEDSLDK